MPILQRSLTRHPNEHRRYFTVHGSVILSKKPSGKNLILPIWPQSTLKRSTVDLLERNSHTFLVDSRKIVTQTTVSLRAKSLSREITDYRKKRKRKGKLLVKVIERGLVLLKDRNRADSDIRETRDVEKRRVKVDTA